VDAVEVLLLLQELKPLHVPGHVAGVRLDLEVLHRGDEAFFLLLEVLPVGERQPGLGLLEYLPREFRGRFPLGMEVPFRRGCPLSACGTFTEEHVTRHGERREGLHELASGRHHRLLM
jgi:hypothetical protein